MVQINHVNMNKLKISFSEIKVKPTHGELQPRTLFFAPSLTSRVETTSLLFAFDIAIVAPAC